MILTYSGVPKVNKRI